jgi:hypothetical protein
MNNEARHIGKPIDSHKPPSNRTMPLLKPDLEPDLEQAKRFLKVLDPVADMRLMLEDFPDGFTFQTFDDKAECRTPDLARIFHGKLDDLGNQLAALNGQEAGIFVTINETDMTGRKLHNITRVRAVWIDDDQGNAPDTPLEPHLITETSPGKFHKIFLVNGLTPDQHQQLQQVLIEEYGSDPNAKDLARVLRVPGFYHCKGKPFKVQLIHKSGTEPYSAEQVLDAFKVNQKLFNTAYSVKSRSQCSHVHSEIVTEGFRNSYLTRLAGTMRRPGMSEEAILAALLAENDAKCVPPIEEAEVKQIARSIAKYEPSHDQTANQQITQHAIRQLNENPGAIFEPAAIEAFRRIKEENPAEFQRQRALIKEIKPSGVSLSDWDKLIKVDSGGSEGAIVDQLVELIRRRSVLFHDPERRGFASIQAEDERGNHVENWPIDSQGFEEWLSYAFYTETQASHPSGIGAVPSELALKQAKLTANGIAKHEGEEYPVWLRCAPYLNGYIIDLCDKYWRVVEVLPTGWRILEESPVKFFRTPTMSPLPCPVKPGNLASMWEFCNIPAPSRVLVLAWILECWRPETPFPLLEMVGPQGSAKSSTQNKLRELIDPNRVNLRAAPKNVEDIFVGAGCNWLSSFNNLSHLTAQQQDALCTLATGGGLAMRKFYSNNEESVIEAKRPCALNGIAPVVTAQDLNDRVVHVQLPPIAYIPETELVERWEQALPSILAGIFDLFSGTLKALPDVKLERLPRMADFARLGTAMMSALDEPGDFLEIFEANRKESVLRGLDACPVACAVLDLASDEKSSLPIVYEGTLKNLHQVLKGFHHHQGDAWPKSPRGLSEALRRQAPALATMDVKVSIESKPRRDGYHVKIVYDRPQEESLHDKDIDDLL